MGFGLTLTNCRDRLSFSIKSYYLQKKKVDTNQLTKCIMYIYPIHAGNKHTCYGITITSFKSTYCCNIMCVNNINANRKIT